MYTVNDGKSSAAESVQRDAALIESPERGIMNQELSEWDIYNLGQSRALAFGTDWSLYDAGRAEKTSNQAEQFI